MFRLTYLSDQKLICEGQRPASCLTRLIMTPLVFFGLIAFSAAMYALGHIILQLVGAVVLLIIFGVIFQQVERFFTWHRYAFDHTSGWLWAKNWCRIPWPVMRLRKITDVVFTTGTHVHHGTDSEGYSNTSYTPYHKLELICAGQSAYVLHYEQDHEYESLSLLRVLESINAMAEAKLAEMGQATSDMSQRDRLLDGVITIKMFLGLPTSEA